MKRYYYKSKNGNGFLNLKSSLSQDKLAEYDEITEEEFNALTIRQKHKPTEKQLRRQQIQSLKSQLAATDYQVMKYAEGWISEEDYAPIKAQRQSLRDQINALEAQLG